MLFYYFNIWHFKTRQAFKLTLLQCVLISALLTSPGLSENGLAQNPNIILINFDDADSEMLEVPYSHINYPNINDVADSGITFTNLHVTTPFCGPSRACLYRAQYAHNTGIRVNDSSDPKSHGFDGGFGYYDDHDYFQNDLSTWMQDAGYRTMLVGKFLHHDFRPIVPSGWDDFYSYLGNRYWDTWKFTNEDAHDGAFEQLPANLYRTTAETLDAVRLIEQHVQRNDGRPFFLNVNPFGPHNAAADSPGRVDFKMRHWWPNIRIPSAPSFNEESISDKRGFYRGLPKLQPELIQELHGRYRERALALRSCDDMVGEIRRTLDRLNLDDNTYIMITSDNGFTLGHHRAYGKGTSLDRSTRVPLYVMGPGVPKGSKANHLMAHIDIGPTIVELAHGSVPSFVDGRSFSKLLTPTGIADSASFRNAVLIENWSQFLVFGQEAETASTALRTTDMIYTEWANGDKDFFDLRFDPDQLNNTYAVLNPATKEFFANWLRKLKNPNQKSKARFSVPFEEFEQLTIGQGLRGLAEDSIGVEQVRLAVYDLERELYWNGQQWQPNFFLLQAELENPGGQITFWNYDQMPDGDNATSGFKAAWVWSYDRNFRHDSNTLTIFETE